MDFIVADNIEMVDFNVGDNVTFTFEVRDDLVITDISLESDEQHGKENKPVVDHSNH